MFFYRSCGKNKNNKRRKIMKNRNERYWIYSLTIFVVTLILVASTPMVKAADTPIELKLAYQYTNVSLPGRAMEYFAHLVNERSKGRVKITTFPSNTLLAADKTYEGVVTGIADIGNTTPAYTAARFPANDSTLLPIAIKTAWTYTHTAQDWYEKFKPKEFDDTHVFFFNGCGPYAIVSRTKPIMKPEDLKGVKVRAAGIQASAVLKAFGATPVNVPMSEAFDAISKGVVDALMVPTESLKAWKHGDVTKYVTRLPLSFSNPNVTFMNKKKWESLPPDIQKIFNDAAKEMVEAGARAWWYGDIISEEYFLGLGGDRKIIEIPPAEVATWESPLAQLRTSYVADHKNLPAAEYIKYLDERTTYWNSRQPDKKAIIEWVEKELIKNK
jgi:TRAP-type C4-dicarboxylate transport system substrate-binding protein